MGAAPAPQPSPLLLTSTCPSGSQLQPSLHPIHPGSCCLQALLPHSLSAPSSSSFSTFPTGSQDPSRPQSPPSRSPPSLSCMCQGWECSPARHLFIVLHVGSSCSTVPLPWPPSRSGPTGTPGPCQGPEQWMHQTHPLQPLGFLCSSAPLALTGEHGLYCTQWDGPWGDVESPL